MVKEKKETIKKEKSIKKTVGLTVPVYDINGKEKGGLELPKAIFSAPASIQLLTQAVRVFQFNQRQGTASTKTRSEVIGSTRKIYRQKGTGRARHGDIKAPIFVGGGIVGGPKPRDYTLEFNKKQKKKALFGALTMKFKEKAIIGLVDSALKIEPKTKKISEFLKTMKFTGKKVTFILPKMEKNGLVLASRNLPGIGLVDSTSLNTYRVLNSSILIFVGSAVDVFTSHFLKDSK
jgi:large subunit ribosomal protein L4